MKKYVHHTIASDKEDLTLQAIHFEDSNGIKIEKINTIEADGKIKACFIYYK